MSDRGKAIPASEMLQIGTEPSRGAVRLLRCDFSYRKYVASIRLLPPAYTPKPPIGL